MKMSVFDRPVGSVQGVGVLQHPRKFNKVLPTQTEQFREPCMRLKGEFSSGREGALASKFNYDFKLKQLSEVMRCIYF